MAKESPGAEDAAGQVGGDGAAGRFPWLEPIFPAGRMPGKHLADLMHFGLEGAVSFTGPLRQTRTTQAWLEALERSRASVGRLLEGRALQVGVGVRVGLAQLPTRWHDDLLEQVFDAEPELRVLLVLDGARDGSRVETVAAAVAARGGVLVVEPPQADPLPLLERTWSDVERHLPPERVAIAGVDWRTLRWSAERKVAGVVFPAALGVRETVAMLEGLRVAARGRLLLSGAVQGSVDVLAVPRCAELLLASGMPAREVESLCGGMARRLLLA